jgi:hypothetical protein
MKIASIVFTLLAKAHNKGKYKLYLPLGAKKRQAELCFTNKEQKTGEIIANGNTNFRKMIKMHVLIVAYWKNKCYSGGVDG